MVKESRSEENRVVRLPVKKREEYCPICDGPISAARLSDRKYGPFCSARCADVDLGRWLKGSYSIPTNEPAMNDDFEPEDEA